MAASKRTPAQTRASNVAGQRKKNQEELARRRKAGVGDSKAKTFSPKGSKPMGARTTVQTNASNRAGALAKRKAKGADPVKATAQSNREGALAKRKAAGADPIKAARASNIAGQKRKNAAKKK